MLYACQLVSTDIIIKKKTQALFQNAYFATSHEAGEVPSESEQIPQIN